MMTEKHYKEIENVRAQNKRNHLQTKSARLTPTPEQQNYEF